MKDIQLPEFGMPKYFMDLNDIVKQLEDQDRKFKADFLEIKTLEKGQVRRFTNGPIGASDNLVVLKC
jgi:hypothetical protein